MKKFFSLLLAAVLIISVMAAGMVPVLALTYRVGDADSDGDVTIFDATQIQRSLAKMSVDAGFSAVAADADRNGKLEIYDVTEIQRYLAHYVTAYPIDQIITEEDPTQAPTDEPTSEPTQAATEAPTTAPTVAPTRDPYELPPV